MKKLIPLLVIAALVYGLWSHSRGLRTPAGETAGRTPVQTKISPMLIEERDQGTITGVATFQLQARVLSRKRYFSGPSAKLAPYDIAVGWGPMSDQSVLDGLKISQSNRFYFYKWRGQPPIPRKSIGQHSSNMHLIPADSAIRKTISKVKKGEIITLDGYLVNVSGPDGFSWRSSTNRNDSGNGACEIVYVTNCESAPPTPN